MEQPAKNESRDEIFPGDRWVKPAGRSGLAIFLAFYLIPALAADNIFLGPLVSAVQMLLVCLAIWSLAAALAGFVRQWRLAPASERREFIRSRNEFRLQRAMRRRN